MNRLWFMASDMLSESTIKNKYGEFDISKRIFSPSAIRNAIYGDSELTILTLFLLAVLLLYTGIVLGRITKKKEC